MAGPNPAGLNSEAFQAGIRLAMQLGLPTDVARRPIFYLADDATTTPADDGGVPWDMDDDANATETAVSGVLCAIEFDEKAVQSSDGGTVAQTAQVVITLLQTEYDQVKLATRVTIAGRSYRRDFDRPDLALGTNGVYQLVFKAGDL